MFNAGFKTVEDLAAITPEELVKSVKNVNKLQAMAIIKAAKHSVMEKIDTFQELLMEMKEVVKTQKPNPVL